MSPHHEAELITTMHASKDRLAPAWRTVLERNGLASFEALWAIDAPDVDEPNRRGDAYRRVARLELPDDDGVVRVVFVKRQEEWWVRDFPRHRLASAAEARNLRGMRADGLPVPEVVFAGRRVVAGRHVGIIVTAARPGVPLDQALESAKDLANRRAIIARAARAVRAMHDRHWRHCSLYAKHILIDGDRVSFIDVERSRRWPIGLRRGRRDLESLARRSTFASMTDRLHFLQSYMRTEGLTPQLRALWSRVGDRVRKKMAR